MMLSMLEEIQSLNTMGVEILEEGNCSEAAAALACCLSHLSCRWCILSPTPTIAPSFCLSAIMEGENYPVATNDGAREGHHSSSTTTARSCTYSATAPNAVLVPNSSAPTTTTTNTAITTISHPVPTLLQCPPFGTTFWPDPSTSGQHQSYFHCRMAHPDGLKSYLGYPTYFPNTICPNSTTTSSASSENKKKVHGAVPSFVIHVYCEEEDMLDPRSEYFGHPFLFEYFDHCSNCSNCKYNGHGTPCCSLVGTLRQSSEHELLLQCGGTAATTNNMVPPKTTEAQNGNGCDGSCFYRSRRCEACPYGHKKHEVEAKAQQTVRPDATHHCHKNDNEEEEAEDKDDNNHGLMLTSRQHAAITICCLFNLALCYHLEWERGHRASTGLLESALSLYHYAFFSFTQPVQNHHHHHGLLGTITTPTMMDPCLSASSGSGEGHHSAVGQHSAAATAASFYWLQNFCSPSDPVLKVLMAICTNATQCHVELVAAGGGGDSPKQVSCWNQILNHILHYCHARDLYHPTPEETIRLKRGGDCVRFSSFCTEQQQQHNDTRMHDNDDDTRMHDNNESAVSYGDHNENHDDDDDDGASGSWPSCHDFFTLHAFLNSLPQQIARAA
ncbi:hypothetical protein ACA910_010889 [Epithemia clementina (nom. ined.)]